jgi:replicative DNA helicase
MTQLRVPPHNLDAEGAVLSACLQRPELIDEVRALLIVSDQSWSNPTAFYSDANRRIFEAMCALDAQGTPVDIVSVCQELRAHDRLVQVGGSPYLAQIIDATPAVSNVRDHALIVRHTWRSREAIRLSHELIAEAYGTGVEQQRLERFESDVSTLAHSGAQQTGLRPFGEIATEVAQALATAKMTGVGITGHTTGFLDIDSHTTGGHEGDFLVIAGRPGTGKTALALCMAVGIAASGLAVPFFSLEMPSEQLVTRILSSEARIDLKALRDGSFTASDLKNIERVVNQHAQLPLFIDDTAHMTPLEIRARVRKLQREIAAGRVPGVTQLGGVFVDYVQLVHPQRESGSREQDVSSVARAFKQMAKELALPIYALAQLNRKVEERTDKRPQLSDLRESGSLEQDTDVVMFLYRPSMYDKTDDESLKGWAELIIAKQRNGPTCAFRMAFQEEFSRFANYERESHHAYENPANGGAHTRAGAHPSAASKPQPKHWTDEPEMFDSELRDPESAE